MATHRPTPAGRHAPPESQGFSLVEVVLAIAVFATVLLGMLALLANGVKTRAEIRRDTIAVQICQQLHQSLRGFRPGIDDTEAAPASQSPGLLDEFFPISFTESKDDEEDEDGENKPTIVLGFDSEGNKRGKSLAADYDDGTNQDGVAYLATVQGVPSVDNPGLTKVTIGIEYPAGDPAWIPTVDPPGGKQKVRKRREFRVLMPLVGRDTATPEATP